MNLSFLAHEHVEECLEKHPCKRCKYRDLSEHRFPCKACGGQACFFDVRIPADDREVRV